MIYYGRQSINEQDIQSVTDVLRSDWLTQGPAIETFEKKVAAYCGAKYAVAVSNATAALHIACLAAGLRPGGALWTVPNTFVASANCSRYCGANVDFVDIDPATYNMSVEKLEQKLAHSPQKPDIVVPVHFSGQSCEMEAIKALSGKYGFTILEDASHAIGADYKATKVGSCRYADLAVFSFHPVKIITTGEGGMVLTNREDLYEKLLLYRSHGITRKAEQMSRQDGSWYYEQIDLGYNYRLTDLQAALGVSQMDRLDAFVARRRELAQSYDRLLEGLPLKRPWQHPDTRSAWHLYVVRLDMGKVKKSKRDIFAQMKERGVALNLHYIPVHMQPYYQKLGFQLGDYPQAEQYYREAFTLPLYCELSDEQQKGVVQALTEVLQ